MRVSRVLNLTSHTSINLKGLKLGEEIIHGEHLIVVGLHDGLDLGTSHGTINQVQELQSSIMVIVWNHDHIGPHIVHNHGEPLKHSVN
jgi:hypothetical protein